MTDSGADVVINDGTSPLSSFGIFDVEGSVTWSGGTYRPIVYAPSAGAGASTLWYCSQNFTISGNALIAPGAAAADGVLNAQAPTSGQFWKVIQAQGGIADTVPLTAAGWTLVIEPGDPPLVYDIQAS